jgi:hypothetical protein
MTASIALHLEFPFFMAVSAMEWSYLLNYDNEIKFLEDVSTIITPTRRPITLDRKYR